MKHPVTSPSESVGVNAAGDVVMRYVAVQVQRLLANEELVRTDQPEAVHQMRVALRRLRSALASYRPIFDGAVTEPLRAELAWLGGALGPARDLEVLRAGLAKQLKADGHADMLLRAQVDRQLLTRRSAALDEIRWDLDGERFDRLRTALIDLVNSPPLTGEAARNASAALPRRVEKSWRQLREAVRGAEETGLDDATRALRLHEARKKAKRARYAAEVARPQCGRPATRFVKEMKRVQTALGRAQDGAVSVVELERLAPGVDNAFALGRAQVLEERRIAAQVGAFGRVWKRASGRRVRRWLR